jgi:cytochrome c oxidase accessory protein FixG
MPSELELPVLQPWQQMHDEQFRAELASVASDGKRKWIYAKKPKGKFTMARTALSWVLLGFFALAPIVKIGGNQFLLLNIIERKFVFFGVPFWPSDFYLVAVLFLLLIVSIVIFTATLGRIWCGWLCPQTVFLEMVFRKIEWLIDGTPGQQQQRDSGPWNWDRIWHFAAKQSTFFTISFIISNLFLAYVISSDTLFKFVFQGPVAHLETFLGLTAFTGIFYLVFARYREQACLVACPYGRFMSALVDENTVTVTYDWKRGEPRTKWKRQDARTTSDEGHCVDCFECVRACPTGVDIRNGIQLECVACTACLDACDTVMDKVGLPKGLIRYTSAKAVETRTAKWLTPRIKAYFGIWTILAIACITLFFFRETLQVDILRAPGTTWTQTADGIANFYELVIINKTDAALPYTFTVTSPKEARVTALGLASSVPAGEVLKGRFLLTLPKEHEKFEHEHEEHGNTEVDIFIDVNSGEKTIKHVKTEFLLP